MDGSSFGAGIMAVFAVSGSVVLLGHHLHKRFLSDFMRKMEYELGSRKSHPKKKVRFTDDVMEPSSTNKQYRRRHSSKSAATAANRDRKSIPGHRNCYDNDFSSMPLNWQALYKGLTEYKAIKGHYIWNCR